VIAKWHRFFSDKRVLNCYLLFSDKGLPNGVAYSAIKESQIRIAFFSNKRAPNHNRLFLAIIEHRIVIAYSVIK
jgi:hypothetical protein